MRAIKKVWRPVNKSVVQPVIQKYGKKGAALLVVATLAVTVVGGGAVRALILGGSGSPATSTSVELNKGLVGHWKMDGNAKDASPYANDGALSGTGGPTLVADRKSKASSSYNFAGSDTNNNQTITVPIGATNPELNVSGDVTVSAWIKPSSSYVDTNQMILRVGQGADLAYSIVYDPTNQRPMFQWYDGAFQGVNATAGTAPLNQWSHVIIVRSGTTITFYVNGQAAGGGTATAPTVTPGQLSIGRTNNAGVPQDFSGVIDDTRVYNRAINTSEVSALSKQYDAALEIGAGEKGLKGHWKMDGNAKDATPNSNNGTVTGAVLDADRKGRANSAYDFNGSNNFINAGTGNSLEPSTELTLSAWVRPDAVTGASPNYNIISKMNYGAQLGYRMYLAGYGGSNGFGFGVGSGSTSSHVGPGININSIGTWYHLAATFQSGTIKMYINGNLVYTTTTGVTSISNTPLAANIGRHSEANEYFNGAIDDVRMYARTLSAGEIKNQYNSYDSQVNLGGGRTGGVNLSAGLLGQWGLNGGAKDATPFANNGTLSNVTATTDRKNRANSAYSFNGSTSTVSIPALNGGAISTDKITYVAWVYPNANQNPYTGILYSRITQATGIHTSSTGLNLAYTWNNNNAATFNWTSGLGLVNNQWNFVALTISPTQAIGYLGANGGSLQTATNNIAHVPQSLSGVLMIGQDSNTPATRTFNGKIDDARVYNRTLTPAELEALYRTYN